MSEARAAVVAEEAAEAETGPADRFTGRSMPRVEDDRILSGQAVYVNDETPADCLNMALVRSRYAHARITSVDVAAAEDHPECALVLTADAIAEAGFNPMPCGLEGVEEQALEDVVVRFAGEPVAGSAGR